MKTKKMKALSTNELRNVNGGHNIPMHIHCTKPAPGTCECVPLKNGEIREYFKMLDFPFFILSAASFPGKTAKNTEHYLPKQA